MKPYPQELRHKVVSAYKNNEGTQREIAQKFCVSLSFVQNLLRRYRCSGTVEPKPHGGGQSPKLNPEQIAVLTQIVKENKNLTLIQLCQKLEQLTGVWVSRATMGRMIHKLNLQNYRNNRKINVLHKENQSVANANDGCNTRLEIMSKQSYSDVANSSPRIDCLTA